MSGWWTEPGTSVRMHRNTDATNMREHREVLRRQADTRNATTQPERRSRKAEWAALKASDPTGTVTPTPAARKRSRQKRRKYAQERLAASEQATRDLLDQDTTGVEA